MIRPLILFYANFYANYISVLIMTSGPLQMEPRVCRHGRLAYRKFCKFACFKRGGRLLKVCLFCYMAAYLCFCLLVCWESGVYSAKILEE